jgi:pSer/pThr/pTyr-binding forkhead associated (FHA) protein
MSKYIADYKDELRSLGHDRLARDIIHPVLVLSGVAGTLRDQQKRAGTVVTDLNETLTLSRLVGRVFDLVKRRDSPPGPISVGRSAENDVVITDYSISNRHCYFMTGGPQTMLVDCGSTNGTLVAGKPALPRHPVPLQGGETVVLGRFAFVYLRPSGLLDFLAKAD